MSYRRFMIYAVSFLMGYKFLLMVMGSIVVGTPLFSPGILDIFMRNDSFWYETIVRLGYPTKPPELWVQTPFPFFPLYPLIIKTLNFITGHFQTSAFIFSCIGNFFLAHFIYKYFSGIGWKAPRILGFMVFYQFFPFHYFFQVYYTEQLYVTLFFALFHYLNKHSISGIFICCLLISVCRPTGLLLCFSMFIWFLLEAKNYRHLLDKKILWQALAFIGAPLGLGLWMLYLHLHCGDALAFKHAMQAWQRDFQSPGAAIKFTHGAHGNFLSGWTLLMVIIAVIAVMGKSLNERLLVGINVFFPLLTGQAHSYYRYFSVVFPVFKNVFEWMKKPVVWVPVSLLLLGMNLFTFYIWLATSSFLAY